jgi:hypothetical protein
MYDERSLLVDNEIDRYVIRPDTSGLTLARDKSLTIRVQHTRPDGAPLGNWLPAPQGIFNVALRIYLPQPPVLERSWFPQALTRVTPRSV